MLAPGVGAQGDRGAFLDAPTGGTAPTLQSGSIRHVANLPYTGGSDLEFTRAKVGGTWRDYVVLGRLSRPVRIVEITDPERPRTVATIPCSLYQNDIQIRGSILIMAADSSSTCVLPGTGGVSFRGFATADISDPRNPVVLGIAQIPQGAHNVTVHPTRPLVYVSNSNLLEPGVVHIWSIKDPANPVKVQDWAYYPLHSPHDITFNADGTRAYAASITHTDIFDTTKPRNPVLLHTWVDPAINISHQADPTPDGRFLIVSDEVAGAATGPVCPGGGLHVYDISNELVPPVKVGVFWADSIGPANVCTAHVFRINPDGRTLAVAWYNAGVHVIDFGGLLALGAAGVAGAGGVGTRTIGAMKMPGADTWAAKMWPKRHPGYVFANDMSRGLDIFFVPGSAG